jgi:hypothetical protein
MFSVLAPRDNGYQGLHVFRQASALSPKAAARGPKAGEAPARLALLLAVPLGETCISRFLRTPWAVEAASAPGASGRAPDV